MNDSYGFMFGEAAAREEVFVRCFQLTCAITIYTPLGEVEAQPWDYLTTAGYVLYKTK